jgi:hypothetical protein
LYFHYHVLVTNDVKRRASKVLKWHLQDPAVEQLQIGCADGDVPVLVMDIRTNVDYLAIRQMNGGLSFHS